MSQILDRRRRQHLQGRRRFRRRGRAAPGTKPVRRRQVDSASRNRSTYALLDGHDAATLRVMLPNTPLHQLLLRDIDWPLVMTSGNLSQEPQCTDNEDARRRLSKIADYGLFPQSRHGEPAGAIPWCAFCLVSRASSAAAAVTPRCQLDCPPVSSTPVRCFAWR